MTRQGPRGAARAILWAPVPLLLAFQFYLSAQSTLPRVGPDLPYVDKLHHAAYFFFLASFAVRAGRFGEAWSRSQTAVVVIAGAALIGLSDEGHQSFVPGRSVEVADVLADVAGAALSAAVAERIWIRARLESRPPGLVPPTS